MKHSFPLSRKLFVSHFVSTLVVSSAIGVFLYLNARESIMEQLRSRLSSTAAIVSRDLDANELRDIRNANDVSKLEYRQTLEALRGAVAANPDIAFLYVMRLDGEGRVLFVVDTDASSGQALPGREYAPVDDRLLAGFKGPVADRRFVDDEWGSFISGYAPILNSNGEYLLGIDMRANEARAKLSGIHRAGLGGLVAALLLSWLMAEWMSRHFRGPIEAIVAQCEAVAAGNLDRRVDMRRFDEMDSLIGAINQMTVDLRRAREENLRMAASVERTLDGSKSGEGGYGQGI